jgi:hypothetical protein
MERSVMRRWIAIILFTVSINLLATGPDNAKQSTPGNGPSASTTAILDALLEGEPSPEHFQESFLQFFRALSILDGAAGTRFLAEGMFAYFLKELEIHLMQGSDLFWEQTIVDALQALATQQVPDARVRGYRWWILKSAVFGEPTSLKVRLGYLRKFDLDELRHLWISRLKLFQLLFEDAIDDPEVRQEAAVYFDLTFRDLAEVDPETNLPRLRLWDDKTTVGYSRLQRYFSDVGQSREPTGPWIPRRSESYSVPEAVGTDCDEALASPEGPGRFGKFWGNLLSWMRIKR